MEWFSKFELISLPTLMIKNMYKAVNVKERKFGVPYGYFLNKVFNYFKIVCEKVTSGTIKKVFILNTQIENICVEGKVMTKFPI